MMKLKLTTKIWLSLSILLLGYLSSMLLEFALGRRTESRLQLVSECLIPAANQSQTAFTTFKEQIRYYNNAVIVGEVSFVESAGLEAEEARKTLQAVVDLPCQTAQRKHEIEITLWQLNTFTASAQILYTSMSSVFEDDDDETSPPPNDVKTLEDEAARLAYERRRLQEKLDTVAKDSARELQQELSRISRGTRHQRYTNMLMFFGVAAGTLTLIAVIIKRSITRPLLRLVEIAGDVTAGKNDIQWLPENNHDEIGVLNRALRVMTGKLQTEIHEHTRTEQELTTYRHHLEELVRDRTTELTTTNTQLKQEISERRQAESALKHAKEDAENANRAKSEFLANMSHEIRTPMNTVLGFAELLEGLIADPRQKGYLEAINAGGKSLLTLIDDILDLSKIEAGMMEILPLPVNLREMFQELTQVFHLSIRAKGLELIVEVAEDFPEYLLLDEGRVRQVLFNLIGNAIKFTESGYIKLTVEAQGIGEADECCQVIVTVEDSGIGILESHRESIFDAFTQQDGQDSRKYGGTGLGLAITKRLIEAMGGAISLTSEVGTGSLFTIAFHQVPIVAPDAILPRKQPVDNRHVVFDAATILVVDDVQNNRSLIKEFLYESNLTVLEAENGKQALFLAQQHRPALILMDLRMPVMDGYEAAKHIKDSQDLRAIPVIALTASAMKHEQDTIYESGFDNYLLKPVSRSKILQAIASFLPHSPRETRPPQKPREPTPTPALEIVEHLPELLEQLENEGMALWNAARRSGGFSDTASFGAHVQQLGERYALELLQEFSENLLAQVKNFDVAQIPVTLESYPALINAVKQRCRTTR